MELKSLSFDNKYNEVPIFEPRKHCVGSDLILEVWFLDKNRLIIPVHKQFMMDNSPVIRAKFQHKSNWDDDMNNGISTFKIETGHSPTLVGKFIKAMYDGEAEFNEKNAFEFYTLADYLQFATFKTHAKKFITKNMCKNLLFSCWNYNTDFDECCIKFAKKYITLRFNGICDLMETFLQAQIHVLGRERFVQFMFEMRGIFTTSSDLKLKSVWLIENPHEIERCGDIVFDTDFSECSDSDKTLFFSSVIGHINDGNLIKRISEHIFPNEFTEVRQNEIEEDYVLSLTIQLKVQGLIGRTIYTGSQLQLMIELERNQINYQQALPSSRAYQEQTLKHNLRIEKLSSYLNFSESWPKSSTPRDISTISDNAWSLVLKTDN